MNFDIFMTGLRFIGWKSKLLYGRIKILPIQDKLAQAKCTSKYLANIVWVKDQVHIKKLHTLTALSVRFAIYLKG